MRERALLVLLKDSSAISRSLLGLALFPGLKWFGHKDTVSSRLLWLSHSHWSLLYIQELIWVLSSLEWNSAYVYCGRLTANFPSCALSPLWTRTAHLQSSAGAWSFCPTRQQLVIPQVMPTGKGGNHCLLRVWGDPWVLLTQMVMLEAYSLGKVSLSGLSP